MRTARIDIREQKLQAMKKIHIIGGLQRRGLAESLDHKDDMSCFGAMSNHGLARYSLSRYSRTGISRVVPRVLRLYMRSKAFLFSGLFLREDRIEKSVRCRLSSHRFEVRA